MRLTSKSAPASKDKYYIYWSQCSAVVMAKLPKITCNIHVVVSNCHEKTGPGAWVWQGYRWHWKSTFWHSHFICIYAKFVPCKCDVIRVSSSVSSFKTKARNRLHTKTVRALVKVKEVAKMSGGAWCFPHPPRAKQRMSNVFMQALTLTVNLAQICIWLG